jgi:putative transposase
VKCRTLRSPPALLSLTTQPVGDAGRFRANRTFDAYRDDLEFGYRLLADEAEAGKPMANRTVWKIGVR